MSHAVEKIDVPGQGEEIRISLCDEKYTLVITPDHDLKALRYGREWQSLTGDKLIYCMAQAIIDLEERLTAAENKNMTA